MDIKNILKDKDFIDFIQYVSKMQIDIFETISSEKVFNIQQSKLRISYDKVVSNNAIYDDCYLAYKQAFQSLTNLYSSYSSEFASIEEFAQNLFEKLKNYVVSNNVLPSNNMDKKRTLSPTEVGYYETKRQDYIRNILTQTIPNLNTLSAVKVLEDASVEDIANFIDYAEKSVDDFLSETGGDRLNKKLRNAILHEYLVIYLPESYIEGDDLTTKKIEINKLRFSGKDAKYKDTPEHLQALAFLENYILANNLGLTAKGIAFDGFRFFDIKTGKSCDVNTYNLHRTKFSNVERFSQSNFVLNENFAHALLAFPKKFAKIRNKNKIKTTAIVDGDIIETTKVLYRKSFITHDIRKNSLFNDNLSFGNFCKVKEFNKTKGTYSFMLFYIPDQAGEQPIQLFRIDKVESLFKGAPASHNLRGKEKIETTLHTHTYNLIDAVLKNYLKDESLGKMDLSHIFPSAQSFDPKIIEEYFDYFCGIHGRYLKRVNQKKFAHLFKKYKPIEYSME